MLETSSSESKLFFEDKAPVRWYSKLDMTANELNTQARNNAAFLEAFSILEDNVVPASVVMDASDEIRNRIVHLDGKICLLLKMLGTFLCTQASLPDVTSVRVGSRSIQWQLQKQQDVSGSLSTLPEPGECLHMEIYLLRGYPFYLCLSVKVNEVSVDGQDCWVSCQYLDMEQGVQEFLERFVFLSHRRTIAHQRQTRSP